MSTLMNRLSELCVMAAGPVWNYPERMAEISRWLMRFFVLVVLYRSCCGLVSSQYLPYVMYRLSLQAIKICSMSN